VARRAAAVAGGALEVGSRRCPHAPLRDRAWQLRAEPTAYDAAYLAPAEALGDAVLLTDDRRLATAARRALGPRRVRQLA
jgi:predicted nucleic acid-binding protein